MSVSDLLSAALAAALLVALSSRNQNIPASEFLRLIDKNGLYAFLLALATLLCKLIESIINT